MKILKAGKTYIECDLFVIIAIMIHLIMGMGEHLFIMFFSLTLHEMCHTIIAEKLGYKIASIKIQPFGFVAKIDGDIRSAGDEMLIAAAGPMCSFILCICAKATAGYANEISAFINADDFMRMLTEIADFNLMIAIMNLMPALPLDGGRVAKAFLFKKTNYRLANRILSVTGIMISMSLLAIGIINLVNENINMSMFMMSAFLLMAAAKELKNASNAKINSIMRRASTLNRGEYVDIREIAVNENVELGNVISMLSTNKFNIVNVVDSDMKTLSRLDEGILLTSAAKYGYNISMSALIDRLE